MSLAARLALCVASCVALLGSLAPRARADRADAKPDLASFGAGALVVKDAASYDESWSGFWLLDEDPTSGWASPKGDIAPKAFVIELADRDEVSELAFDNGQVDGDGGRRGAKSVTVEISDKADTGYAHLAAVTLAVAKDDQHFAVATPKKGRYLRVTLQSNHGDPDYLELMGFAAYGKRVDSLPRPDASGAYATSFGTFRVLATGSTATGCYESKNGLIKNGGFDGRVLRFTWSETTGEGTHSGPAVLVFPADGKSFLGLWWNGAEAKPAGRWDGKLTGKTVGVCPHYKFDAKAAAGGDVAASLRADGRARIYGITFDVDSDHLRDESRATLDQLVAIAKAEPSWKLAIEGHTDSSGAADHNQTLSEKRAAAVKDYLVKAGVAAARLTTAGFGATRPVSTNDTSLGRSQNRRVEVVRS